MASLLGSIKKKTLFFKLQTFFWDFRTSDIILAILIHKIIDIIAVKSSTRSPKSHFENSKRQKLPLSATSLALSLLQTIIQTLKRNFLFPVIAVAKNKMAVNWVALKTCYLKLWTLF